jgi:2-methylisocitrate lyase-like PEP mutase family enzyme
MTLVRERLRAALNQPGLVVAPFVYDGLQAMVAQQSGFSAVYMTGFGTAASRGMPDLGLLTMSEMAANARWISKAVEIPVICDADTGYGNPLNVLRTVEEFEDAGAAALHIEDQIWPKRCGFLEGKQVIPLDEMVQKVRAACDGRTDPNLVIIARTDALQGEGWGGTEERARSYFEAGADLVFVDGIRTITDLDEYSRRLSDHDPHRDPGGRLSGASRRDEGAPRSGQDQLRREREPLRGAGQSAGSSRSTGAQQSLHRLGISPKMGDEGPASRRAGGKARSPKP